MAVRKIVVHTFFYLWLFLAAIAGLASWLTPVFIEDEVQDYFKQHDAEIAIERFSVNLFTSSVNIEGVLISQREETLAELGVLSVNVDLLALVRGEIVVDKLLIGGLNLTAVNDKDEWQVKGVFLPENSPEQDNSPELDNSREQESSREPQNSSETNSAQGWPIYLAQLELTNSRFLVEQKGIADELKVHRITLEDLSVQGNKVALELAAVLSVNSLPLVFDSQIETQGNDVNLKFDLDEAELSLKDIARLGAEFIPEQVNINNGRLVLENEFAVAIKGPEVKVDLSESQVELKDVEVVQNQLAIELSSLRLSTEAKVALVRNSETVNDAASEGETQDKPQLSLSATNAFIAENLIVKAVATGDMLTSVKQLEIPKVSVEQQVTQDAPKITIERVNIDELLVSQVSDTAKPAALKINAIAIDNSLLTATSLDIETITLETLDSQLLLDNQQQLTTLFKLSNEDSVTGESVSQTNSQTGVTQESTAENTTTEQSKPVADSEVASEPAMTLRIGELVLTPDSLINLEDLSHTVPVKQVFDIEQLQLKNIQNYAPENEADKTDVKVAVKVGKYGTMKIDAQMPWIKDNHTFNGTLDIKNVSLPKFSPYLNQSAGLAITAGQFDMLVDLNALDGHFDGEATLEFRGLKLGGQSENDDGTVNDKSNIGLNAALAKLADDKGNFGLTIPIEGELENIQFGSGGLIALIIEKALYESAKSYVLNTMVPYSMVANVAIVAGQQLFKIRMNDLDFEASQVAISPSQNEFVKELAALMTAHDDVQVQVCPYVTKTELSQAANSSSLDSNGLLQKIGTERAEALKDVLVEQHAIAPSRLLLCSPQLDEDEKGQPRLTFDIS